MIVLDTTVLVYAVGAEHPLRDRCRRVIELVGEGELAATTTVEVIQEFVHVRARRRSRPDAAELGRRYTTLLSPLLVLDSGALDGGLALFESSDGLGAFDAVLIAAAHRAGVTAIVSADRGFAEGLVTWWDPSDPGFVDRLSR